MRISVGQQFSTLSPENIVRYVQFFCQNVANILNNGISFSDNFNAQIVSTTFKSANTSVVVSHSLNRLPTGYIPISLSAAMIVFTGSAKWTTATISLQASQAGSASLLIF